MATSKTRQRKLVRAKMERQLARRATKARRNRQLQAGLAVGLVVIAVVVALFLGGVFSSRSKPKPKPTAATATCVWNAPADADTLTDVGRPPTSGEPRTGTEAMTVATDQGTIGISLDLAKAPCAVSSFHYLAGKNFFTNTRCDRLTTSGTFFLRCGDPRGDGTGGPAYTFPDENLPAPTASTTSSASASPSPGAAASPSASAAATATYPRGTVAMFTKGPDSNGSQFFIVYRDSQLPSTYSIIGTVTSGLDVVDKVAAAGAVDAGGKATGDGTPKTPVTIRTLTVGTEPSAGTGPPASEPPTTGPSGASNS